MRIYIRADVVAVIGVLRDRRGFDAGDHVDRRNLEAMRTGSRQM